MNARKLCLVLLVLIATAVAEDVVRVPSSAKPVMVDGKIAQGEWTDAKSVDLGKTARLHVKHSGDYVWLAVEFLECDNGTLDLYLGTPDGAIYDLHSSAKIGERTLAEGKWPDFTWWNNNGWVSNFSRVDSWKPLTLLPEKVREYQISRARFQGKEWRVLLELMTAAKPQWQTHKFPADAENMTTKDWMTLRFE